MTQAQHWDITGTPALVWQGDYAYRSFAATKGRVVSACRAGGGSAVAWHRAGASVPDFAASVPATRGTHCRPPGPPASLSLFARGGRLGSAPGGGVRVLAPGGGVRQAA